MNTETFADNLRNKNTLITGASGLICSSFIDLLIHYNEQGTYISIYAMSRNERYAHKRFEAYWGNPLFSFICHNVIESFSLDTPSDHMVHGTSNASPKRYATDPVGTTKSNPRGGSDLLELAKEKKARLLYIFSGEVYGEGDGSDFTEDYSGYVDCLNPRACYPSSKRVSEASYVSYKERYGVDVVIARPCHIYGSDIEHNDWAFAQFLRKAKAGEDILLKGDGSQVRFYCHVDDCASALLCILLRGIDGKTYSIANKDSVLSIKGLAELTAQTVGVKIMYDIPSNSESRGYSKVQRAVLDSSLLESLDWRPQISLKEGLRRVLGIYK